MSLKNWITPDRTALLLVDMQMDFASPDGALGKADSDMTMAQAALRNAEALAQAARAANVPCVFVRLLTREDGVTNIQREYHARRGDAGPPLCREGTPGAAFVGPQPQGGELVFSKKRYDAFSGTGLDAALRADGRDTLVVCGLTTECCIDSTVRHAFERDYHVFIASDAVAAYEVGLHDAALRALTLNCAISVPVSDIQAAWNT